MNKTTFEVGKTYLTRGGQPFIITSIMEFMMTGFLKQQNDSAPYEMWHINGKYQSSRCELAHDWSVHELHMDLMPEAIFEDNSSKVEHLKEENASLFKANLDLLKQVDELQTKNKNNNSKNENERNGFKVAYLKKENDALYKVHADFLIQIDALQKENGRLHVELQETRMIAREMVDMVKRGGIHKIL